MGKFVDKICTEPKDRPDRLSRAGNDGYELGLRFTEVAERIPGHAVNLLAQRASDYSTHIVFGLVTKERVESTIYKRRRGHRSRRRNAGRVPQAAPARRGAAGLFPRLPAAHL